MEIMEEVPHPDAVLVSYNKTELTENFKMIMKNSNIKINVSICTIIIF